MALMKNYAKKTWQWIKNRIKDIPKYDKNSGLYFIIVFLIATTTVAIVLALGYPTGAGPFAQFKDIVKAIGLNILGLGIGTFLLASLFSFIYLPLPRLTLGGFLYTNILTVYALNADKSGMLFSYIAGIGYSVVVLLIGLMILMVARKNKLAILVVCLIFVGVIGSGAYNWLNADHHEEHAEPAFLLDSNSSNLLNPGTPGEYDYRFFTYGSGTDKQREAFGSKVEEVTPTLDASSWVTEWNEKRKEFWGFDASELPINGRVWLPEGEGPFPVVLIVHGNHTMEYFSTEGYDYLGEQLASRGFLTISVDEDFINYSNVSGIPNDDYTLRAWMLLQHLVELKNMNQSPDSLLFEKLDLNQVALVGHSRGGQAAIMAADYGNYFTDDGLNEEMKSIQIQAVATIAPTDKTIDEKKPHLHNVSYLSLQGARDADVKDFRGDRQFYRTTFNETTDKFKSTLYIEGANHTQFNSQWGRLDLSLPRGVFLNQRDTISAKDQRQIAKVYLSAFFERVFHGKLEYDKLLANHHYGKDWLPDTEMVSKYRDSTYKSITNFDEIDPKNIEEQGMTQWELMTPVERGGEKHLRDSLLLEWKNEAQYRLDLSGETLSKRDKTSGEQLVFTMANVDEEEEKVPDIDVELKTSDDVSVKLPLNDFKPFQPVISTHFTPFGLFDNIFRDGKYESSWEPIFQTFDIPLAVFEQKDSNFNKEHVTGMTLHFKNHPGKILLEEIGVR